MKNIKIKNVLFAAALGLTASLASCAGEASAHELNMQAESALQELDYDGAKADYESALTTLGEDTASADYLTAKLGVIECLAHLDADGCKSSFMALAEEGGLVAKDYSYIAGLLASANNVSEGIAVAGAGITAFPGDTGLDNVLQSLVEKAKSSGNAEDLGALGGLGYL